jgi:hypothetical protein
MSDTAINEENNGIGNSNVTAINGTSTLPLGPSTECMVQYGMVMNINSSSSPSSPYYGCNDSHMMTYRLISSLYATIYMILLFINLRNMAVNMIDANFKLNQKIYLSVLMCLACLSGAMETSNWRRIHFDSCTEGNPSFLVWAEISTSLGCVIM